MANPWRALISKELRESRWKLILALALLGATGAFLGPAYDWLLAMMPGLDTGALPEWLSGPLAMQLGNYRLYLWSNWYGKNLWQLVAILAAVYGAGLVAGEYGRGTGGFLFSKPVRRGTVLWTKFFVAWGILAAAALAGTGLTLVGSGLAGRAVDGLWFTLGLPAATAGTGVVLGLALLFSVLTRDTVKALGLTLLVLVASFVVAIVPGLRPYTLFYRMAGGATLATGGVEWPAVLVMLAVALALVRGAEVLLGRQDI